MNTMGYYFAVLRNNLAHAHCLFAFEMEANKRKRHPVSPNCSSLPLSPSMSLDLVPPIGIAALWCVRPLRTRPSFTPPYSTTVSLHPPLPPLPLCGKVPLVLCLTRLILTFLPSSAFLSFRRRRAGGAGGVAPRLWMERCSGSLP